MPLENPETLITTNTEQLTDLIQYVSNNQELLKELIFWEKSSSFLMVMIVVISAFTVFSSYLKGLIKR